MRKVIIFDLKNTLIDEDLYWVNGAEVAFDKAIASSAETVLYSMNENWTYQVMQKYKAVFTKADTLLLKQAKISSDLVGYTTADVLVVGDSLNEELRFAEELGYKYLRVNGVLYSGKVDRFLKGNWYA